MHRFLDAQEISFDNALKIDPHFPHLNEIFRATNYFLLSTGNVVNLQEFLQTLQW